ncbi:MAG: protein-glutamate O-methyltransferase CheR [Acidobacteriota bacterium]
MARQGPTGQTRQAEACRPSETEEIEIQLLLEAIYQRYGYDFRSYARASIDRRTRQFLSSSGCASLSEMIPKVLHDETFFSRLAQYFSISVTEMFRDPFVYQAVREKVVPLLRTWPFFKVWVAGCATGEEVYSLAILLKEEGVYDRATVYATDFNDSTLDRAREGIYEMGKLQEATRNYQQAGGKASFSEYYHARYDAGVMDHSLKERITFANHNLTVDTSFGEMHLVFCRNVLIYFNRDLQNRALGLFTDSLVHGGFLCLGTAEDLRLADVSDRYEVVDGKARIYKKSECGTRSAE